MSELRINPYDTKCPYSVQDISCHTDDAQMEISNTYRPDGEASSEATGARSSGL